MLETGEMVRAPGAYLKALLPRRGRRAGIDRGRGPGARERQSGLSNFRWAPRWRRPGAGSIPGATSNHARLTVCAERWPSGRRFRRARGRSPAGRVADNGSADRPPAAGLPQIVWEFCGDVEIILANRKAGASVSGCETSSRGPSMRRSCSLLFSALRTAGGRTGRLL